MRCDRCKGVAHPALAHLHGLSESLCKSCSDAVVARIQEAKVEETLRKAMTALVRERAQAQRRAA